MQKYWGSPDGSGGKESTYNARDLGSGRCPGKRMATHSRILAWRSPWTEEPGGPQIMGSQRVRHSWVTNSFTSPFFIAPLGPQHLQQSFFKFHFKIWINSLSRLCHLHFLQWLGTEVSGGIAEALCLQVLGGASVLVNCIGCGLQ